jgi:hypothetical protein
VIQLSMEVPTPFLESWSPLTDVDFALAHRVLEDAAYAKYYRTRPAGRELLLDNSMHELGAPLEIQQLLDAANLCRADVVISPDQLKDPAWTLEQFNKTKLAFKDTPFEIAVVLQSKTGATTDLEDFLEQVGEADMIMLPYREDRWDWFDRVESSILLWSRVHLLGVSELQELRWWAGIAKEYPEISWSVDTGKPVKWAWAGSRLDAEESIRHSGLTSKELLDLRPEDLHPSFDDLLKYNIQVLREICK